MSLATLASDLDWSANLLQSLFLGICASPAVTIPPRAKCSEFLLHDWHLVTDSLPTLGRRQRRHFYLHALQKMCDQAPQIGSHLIKVRLYMKIPLQTLTTHHLLAGSILELLCPEQDPVIDIQTCRGSKA